MKMVHAISWLVCTIVIFGISTSGCMEPELKKSKIDPDTTNNSKAAKPWKDHNAQSQNSLASITAQYIISHFPWYGKYLAELPDETRKFSLSPLLLQEINKKWTSTAWNRFALTTQRFDSRCSFTSDGAHIISIHQSNHTARLHPLSEIIRNDFQSRSELGTEQRHATRATNSDTIYVIKKIESDHLGLYSYVPTLMPISPDQKRTELIRSSSKKIFPPLLGTLKKIIPSGKNRVFVCTEYANNNYENPTTEQLIYFINHEGNSNILMIAKNPLVHTIHELKDNFHAVIYENGLIYYADKHLKEIHGWQANSNDSNLKIMASCTNPSGTQCALAYSDGNIWIYNLEKNTQPILIPPISKPYSAITFYDDTHIITANNNPTNGTLLDNEKYICLTLWDINKQKAIASSTQKEQRACNTLCVSPDKKHLVLGMEYYDVAVQTMNSFHFDQQLNLEKIYASPHLFAHIAHKQKFSAADKLALLAAYAGKKVCFGHCNIYPYLVNGQNKD